MMILFRHKSLIFGYLEKLNERILQLLKQNEGLEKKLMWTQEKLIALSLDKGINWLDSMLAFCK